MIIEHVLLANKIYQYFILWQVLIESVLYVSGTLILLQILYHFRDFNPEFFSIPFALFY